MSPRLQHKQRMLSGMLIAYLVVLLSGCGPASKKDDSADIAAIKAVSAARAKAFNERNATEIAVHFTEDGVLMAPGSPATSGRDAVERYYQAIFDQYITGLESGYEEVQVSGDMAYGRGFAKAILVPDTGGDTLVSTAKYINILQRQPDSSWLTTHDIWNENE